jgi:hypothetical protein
MALTAGVSSSASNTPIHRELCNYTMEVAGEAKLGMMIIFRYTLGKSWNSSLQ